MFSELSENVGNWTLSAPQIIGSYSPSGINKDVKVAYTGSNEAIAVWINDPDGLDSTDNSSIYQSYWDGSSWTVPTEFVSNPYSNMSYNELSICSNGNYSAVGWTSNYLTASNNLLNRLDVYVWDQNIQDWDYSKSFLDYDTAHYFYKPRISISPNGLASITYQVVDMYPDTNNIDNGELYLFLNNFNNYYANWIGINGNQFVSDPTTYVWALDAGFGNNNVLYSITQEYNETTGPVTNPSNGILFGDPELSMVFRAITVDDYLNVYNYTEPDCNLPTGFNKEEISQRNDFDILQNYPNPFSDITLIEYTIKKQGWANIDISDIYGKKIMTLIDKELMPGIYQTVFEPKNLSAGIYFYSLTLNGQKTTKKMIIAK